MKKGGGDEEHTDTQIHNHHSHYPRLHTNIRHLQKEEMTDHREVAKDVFLTAYGDGSRTVCNFGKEPFTYEGARIEPLGYALFNPGGTKKTFAFDKDKGLCEK